MRQRLWRIHDRQAAYPAYPFPVIAHGRNTDQGLGRIESISMTSLHFAKKFCNKVGVRQKALSSGAQSRVCCHPMFEVSC